MNATRNVLASAVVLAALVGCTSGVLISAATESTPDAAIYAALGDPSAAGFAAEVRILGAEMTDLVENLQVEVLEGFGDEYSISSAGGFAVAPTLTVVPGLDQPIEGMREVRSRTRDTARGPLSESGRVDQVIDNQELRYTMSYSTSLDNTEDAAAADSRQTNLTIPVCAPSDNGAVTAEWSHERRVSSTDEIGTTTSIELSAAASVTSGSDPRDVMSIEEYTLHATRTTTTSSGESTVERGHLVANFPQWGSELLPTESELKSIQGLASDRTSDWFDAEVGNLLMGTLGGTTLEIKAMIATALEARNDTGLCVSIEYNTGGVTTLAPGETATIVARVVDTRTGEAVPDARIEASAFDGTVTPDSGIGETRFTYEAPSSQPPYTVELSTETPLGGDRATVRFTGGWRFDGVIMSITVDDVTGYQEWSGHVCGDPFTEPWFFTQTVDGFVVEYDLVVPPLGTRASAEYGQQPMIEEVDRPGKGEPPFRLFIDDVEPPEVTPRTQRVEVEVEPAGAECS